MVPDLLTLSNATLFDSILKPHAIACLQREAIDPDPRSHREVPGWAFAVHGGRPPLPHSVPEPTSPQLSH